MRPKWEPVDQATEKGVDLSQAMSKFKLFGAASVQPTLPSALKMSTEKTYKLYIGGKQVRPNTQSSRNVMLGNDLYCVLADASRQDVRNAVEAAHSAATRLYNLEIELYYSSLIFTIFILFSIMFSFWC